MTIALDGRLNTLRASDLEEQLEPALEGVEKLVFDFEKFVSIASARLLARQQGIRLNVHGCAQHRPYEAFTETNLHDTIIK